MRGTGLTLSCATRTPGGADPLAAAEAVQDELGGRFPNFFGHQRFGTFRPITHRVGRALVRGDPRDALRWYLGRPFPHEPEPVRAAREAYDRGVDPAEVASLFPPQNGFERALLHALARHPDQPLRAFEALPTSLQMMFVHAYQGYIFNLILVRRLSEIGAGPIEGDLVCALDEHGNALTGRFIPVSADNLDTVSARVAEGRAAVTAAVPGYECPLAGGVMGAIEREVMEAEGVEPREFFIPGSPAMSSKGTRRPILAPVKDLAIEAAEGGLRFSFTLPKGTYASALLREFMKCEGGW